MSLKSLSAVAAAAMALCAGAAQAQVQGLANGGFELAPNGAGEFADGWQSANGVTRTDAQAHSGSFSALIAIPNGFAGQGLFQNSIDHGGLVAVDPLNWGTAPTLSFWLKGNSSETGNLNYALRYLDASGVILNTAGASSAAKTIWTGNLERDWTQITRTPDTVIPNNTAAVFFEMTLAVGPTGEQPPGNCGVDNSTGKPLPCNYGQAAVYLDDVQLTLAYPADEVPPPAIPEPETYALMLVGLAAVGVAARRRRSA
jgi:hypothetical protein